MDQCCIIAHTISSAELQDLSPDAIDTIKATIDSFLNFDDSTTDADDHNAASLGPSQAADRTEKTTSSYRGSQPMQFLVSGSLNWELMVQERAQFESDFVRDSTRKNSSYSGNQDSLGVRLRKDGSKVDDFGVELMRKLCQYQDGLEYSSSGGYRQMRHTGIPNAAKLDTRGEN